MIYLDHAATSFPKPPGVVEAMTRYLSLAGNPGRSAHRMSQAADDVVWDARCAVAELFGGDEPDRVVFTLNATMALNMAIKGLVRPGDRVLMSSFEHNSVVRPLHALATEGVRTDAVAPSDDSPLDLDRLESELRRGDVRLLVLSHGSNVTGAVLPLGQIRHLTERYGVPVVLDVAQTAGHVPVTAELADVLVFSGHKGLFGPQGTGGMLVSDRVSIRPVLYGGTGGRSESPEQPRWLPFRLEAGTPNGVGSAGLAAAVRYVARRRVEEIAERETTLRRRLVDGLSLVPRLRLHAWPSPERPVGVASATFEDVPAADAAALLEERSDVLVRAGLHCAPSAHRMLGTLEAGTVRFSLCHLTTEAEIDAAVAAVAELAEAAEERHMRTRAAPSGRELVVGSRAADD